MIKKITSVSVILLGSLAVTAYAQTCPVLTAEMVVSIIDKGVINTNQGYTLADETGKKPAQVLIDEPTANPFDTFYSMFSSKKINNQNYLVYVGNILGKESYEARERAKKILLAGDKKTFVGQLDPAQQVCKYEEIHATPSKANYPFKTSYESVVLIAGTFKSQQQFQEMIMPKLLP